MNRSHWCLVFGVVAAASLLLCQSQALADDLLDASYTPVATAGTSAGAAHGACCQETCIPWEGCGCCGNHFYGSAEALFLAPIGSQRDACYEIDNARGRVLGHYDTDCVDNGGLIATPRITLGYQGECWGCEVRYWRMQEPTELNDLTTVDWRGADQQSSFRAETLDLEATRLFCWGETQMQWAFGVRYGEFEQASSVAAYQVCEGDDYAGYASARHAFGGVGLTTALTGVRPIGCGNFSLFYSARASLLWDSNAVTSVQTLATYDGADGSGAVGVNGAAAGTKGNLFIGELEVGGQWNYALKCIPANAFVRAAFEYQYWGVTSDACVGRVVRRGRPGRDARHGVCRFRRRRAHQPARLQRWGRDHLLTNSPRGKPQANRVQHATNSQEPAWRCNKSPCRLSFLA